MKCVFTGVLVAVVSATMSGCATVYRVTEAQSSPIPSPVVEKATRNPAVTVSANAADEHSGSLATSLKSSIEGDFASRGFDVFAEGDVDSFVTLSVSRRETARLSDWRVYEGLVDGRVTDAVTGGLIAANQFKATGERALDDVKAEESVRDALSHDIRAWLANVLPSTKIALPIGSTPPDQAETIIKLRPAKNSEDPADVLRVQRRFMDAVARHSGIASCVLVGEAPNLKEYSFKVVYQPASFPGGLLNTIVLDEPYLGDSVKLEIER